MQSELAILVAGGAVLVGCLVVARALRRRPLTIDAPLSIDDPDAQLAALSDAAPVAFLRLEIDGRVRFANAEARRQLPGLEPGHDLRTVSESLADVLLAPLAEEGAVVREDVLVGDPPRTLRASAVPWGDGVAAILVDVTEEVDFEEARRTFSAAVSHELRTPLARILGLAETLALPGIEEDRAELAVQIENEVEGMRRLIDEMLLLAALDRGRLAVADGVADLAGIVRGVVDDARSRRLGRGRVIRVEAPDAVEVPVAVRLCEVVVQNLIDNALIHGGANAVVTVELAVRDSAAELVVSDDGIGIPAQHLPYVFQRFYRGEASRTGPGSGLGLALVKHIVEAHGGTVAARSDGRQGTELRVRLPLVA